MFYLLSIFYLIVDEKINNQRFLIAERSSIACVSFYLSVKAVADLIPDISLSLFVSTPLKAGISLNYPSSICQGQTPAELNSNYDISDLIFGVSVNFIGKKLALSFNTGFSLMSTSGCR